jgi:hypothetical protein
MKSHSTDRLAPAIALTLGLAAALAGCGSKEQSAPAQAGAAAPAGATQPAVDAVAAASPAAWTAEAMENLLAPIALYPDPVLSQVLLASTNPQEVLDAGNWLLQNQGLSGNALDAAAAKVGFTPPMRALLQFPETVDMMCMELGWTTELGQAFVADQQGVLDAVQRLRKQAMDVGNLQSSPQMKVTTEEQDGKEVVLVSPPSPEVVYVPQYDPVAVYAPAPAAAPAAPAATTTTATGHSTGTLVMTGLLAFGAGMLIADAFNDDDDYYHHNGYYYPNYGHGGMPYYPPYPYRPAYGNGYYPSNGYTRPPNYQHGFNNNNVVVINKDGNNYWNDRSRTSSGYQKKGAYQAKSPITQARPNRPELQQLNERQPRPMPADAKRPSSTAARPTAGTAASSKGSREVPKVQGSYAGATPERVKAQQSAARPTSGNLQQPAATQRPGASGGDRGYDKSAARPQPSSKPSPAAKPQQPRSKPAPSADRAGTAVSGADRGSADRAASQRGKQSMPQGAKSKGNASKGGNKSSGGKQKQGR